MAIMIPDSIGSGTASSGERRLFNRFRKELPDTFFVLHSLDIATHQTKLWAEADFVVIGPGGIFVLEVKSGGVACEEGQWVFTDRYGKKNTRKEGPFHQASSAMFAVKQIVEKNSSLKGYLFGFGVIMPDEDFHTEGPEIDLNVLLPSSRIHVSLGDYVEHIGRYWRDKCVDKLGRSPRVLDEKALLLIRQLLRPDIRSAFTLNSALASLESEQVELTHEQCQILRRIDNNPRTIVTGGAGTGKTLLAVDKATRLAKEGNKVLFLCYNRLLGEHLKTSIKKVSHGGSVEAWSIHSWFSEIISRAGMNWPAQAAGQPDAEYFEEVCTQQYMDALVQLAQDPFDTLVIDEGQDLLREGYLEALDLTVRNGLDRGAWHIFMDPLQNLYGSGIEEALARLREYGCVSFELNVNCRNTIEIAIATATYSGFQSPLRGAPEGGRREDVFYNSRAELIEGIDTRLRKLREGGVSAGDVIILSRYKLTNCALGSSRRIADLQINDLTATRSPREGFLDFSTIHGFKGLERRAVVAIDMVDLLDDESKLLNYCGLSRARSYLACFIPSNEKPACDQLSEEFGTKLATGQMTQR